MRSRRPDDCRRVLVVDDEAPIVDFVAAFLEDEGYEVACAYDGEEAWHRALREMPDLVISDVSMPRLDGVALVRRMGTSRRLHRTPVILMSAIAPPPTLGRAAFLSKPFDLDRMLTLVGRQLRAADRI